MLLWAHRILADTDALRQDLSRMRDGLSGTLRMGAIPTALTAASLLTTREILEAWLDGTPIREEYLIVEGGALAGAGARSYSTRT